eukprot:879435-Prorocentrum_minimum.AAC.4
MASAYVGRHYGPECCRLHWLIRWNDSYRQQYSCHPSFDCNRPPDAVQKYPFRSSSAKPIDVSRAALLPHADHCEIILDIIINIRT